MVTPVPKGIEMVGGMVAVVVAVAIALSCVSFLYTSSSSYCATDRHVNKCDTGSEVRVGLYFIH